MLQCFSREITQRKRIGWHESRMANSTATVTMMKPMMRNQKNHRHLGLVVIRMSIKEIDILAVASADGVIQKATQTIFTAVSVCFVDRNARCLPRP